MKKTAYTKPEIKVVRLQATNLMQALSQGGPVQDVKSDDGFSFDSSGLDSDDDLR